MPGARETTATATTEGGLMFAWLGAVFFAIACLVSGGDLQTGTAWLRPETLMAAGMLCLALHSAGIGPTWGRRG